MEGISSSTPMLRLLGQRQAFASGPFVLLDVGCAGGIAEAWRLFGENLIAHGFDPQARECLRLQHQERLPGVRYHGCFVGLRPDHEFAQRRRAEAARSPNHNPWTRLSAGWCAARARAAAPPATPAAADPDPVPEIADPSSLVGLDEFVAREGLASVDFLKLDVDGPDFEVLHSAEGLLADKQVLGVGMEVNWFGGTGATEHTFHNTDRFLRQRGFTLFGLTVRHYSRQALPSPWAIEYFAQGHFGQPLQGDAIYLRDLASPALRGLGRSFGALKLLKLACLYELLGLPDCAAEVLLTFADLIATLTEVEPLLDALVPAVGGRQLSYRDYIATFERDPALFLPSALHRWAQQPADRGGAPVPDPAPGDSGSQAVSAGDRIVGLFSVAEHQVQHVTHSEGFGPVTVRTVPERWAYALSFPACRGAAGQQGERGPVLVRVRLAVAEGCVGVGLLTPDGKAFVEEVHQPQTEGAVELTLRAPSVDHFGELVIRNTAAGGVPSEATIYGLEAFFQAASGGQPVKAA